MKLTRMIIGHNQIISAAAQTRTHWVGFNPFTEEAAQIPKEGSIELPEVVVGLLGSDKDRAKLAEAMTGSVEQTARLLNISPRSLFRLKNNINQAKK